MKLFVGLGNPGQQYAANRHNVGFMAVDLIADRHTFSGWKKKFSGHIADGQVGSERVLLLKPETYMNESGRAVQAATRFYKIDPEDVFVFYDEIDLAPSKLKVKKGGGNAGHNGLRSITAQFANDYHRIRIGVGHPGDKQQVANYVLSNFSKADQAWLQPMLNAIANAAGHLANDQPDRFLSSVARELRPQPPASKEESPSRRAAGATKNGVNQSPKGAEKHQPANPPASAKGPKPSDRASAPRRDDSRPSLAESLKNWLSRRDTGSNSNKN